jgi:hypothetical protein
MPPAAPPTPLEMLQSVVAGTFLSRLPEPVLWTLLLLTIAIFVCCVTSCVVHVLCPQWAEARRQQRIRAIKRLQEYLDRSYVPSAYSRPKASVTAPDERPTVGLAGSAGSHDVQAVPEIQILPATRDRSVTPMTFVPSHGSHGAQNPHCIQCSVPADGVGGACSAGA